MDRKIKKLMKESSAMIEIILKNKQNIQFDEGALERIQSGGEKDVERKYSYLKERMGEYRRDFLLRKKQEQERREESADNP
jgi:hypothetical protein